MLSIVFRHLGNRTKLRGYFFISTLGMRHGAGGAILYPALNIDEVSAAFVTERKKRATAKHTVKVIPLNLMAGEKFAFLILKILTAVLHTAPPSRDYDTIIIPKKQKCNTKKPKRRIFSKEILIFLKINAKMTVDKTKGVLL